MKKIKVTVKRPNWFWRQFLKADAWVCGVDQIVGFTTWWKTIIVVDGHYMKNDRLLAHELTHVQQIHDLGVIKFTWQYVRESMKKGYHTNKFEVEARAKSEMMPQTIIANFNIVYK